MKPFFSVFPKIVVPQNGWWKSWKTLTKMDDLGVPLVSETSLFSVMLEILDSLLHSWIIQLKLNSLWNTCCLMIRKCTTLLLRPQIYYIAVSRPGGGLKSSWKWRLYLRSDKVRRSTSSTILVSVSIFKFPRLIDAWSFCCFESMIQTLSGRCMRTLLAWNKLWKESMWALACLVGRLVVALKDSGVLMMSIYMFIMFGNADANGRRTKKLKHCWTRRSFESGIRKVWDTCRPWQGTFKIQAVASHTHTHKIPNSSRFSIFFSSCQLPISCQEWEEQEIPWAELIWVLVFHRSFGRRSWFVHIGPWCQWMHQVNPFEGCLKQTCLEMKTCKDHEGHISGHEMTYEFTWLMCLEDIVIHALYLYIYRYIFHRHRHHIGSHECYCSSFDACWDVQLSIRIKEKLDHVHLAQWQGPFCCGYIGQKETRRMKKPH